MTGDEEARRRSDGRSGPRAGEEHPAEPLEARAGPGDVFGAAGTEAEAAGSEAGAPSAAPEGEGGEEAAATVERAAEDETAAAVERAMRQEAELRDQLLRLAAEFDNYRKRANRERLEAWSRAKADLVEKLLTPIDDLNRVAHPEAAAVPPDSPMASLLEGVELVERKFLQVLEREGLEPIEAEGAAFDPAVHEAVLTQPTDDPARDGRVAAVVVPGYRFADRLLRPARVVVWKLQR